MRFGSQTAQGAVAVTPSDSVDLSPSPCRALYVGVTGNISIIPAGGGSAVTLVAVPVGILPVAVSRVRVTNTTASSLVALY